MHTRMLTATHVHHRTRTRAVPLLSVSLLFCAQRLKRRKVDGYAIHPSKCNTTTTGPEHLGGTENFAKIILKEELYPSSL